MSVGGAKVQFRNVGLAYPSAGLPRSILADISFDIAPGECLAIVGPSGVGKSTLLSMLMGRFAPTQGEIEVSTPSGAAVRRAIVFQSPTLMPWLTAAENVRLPLELEGRLQAADEHVGEMLARVGLGDFSDYRPSQLSGGMQSRVALARALVTHPDLLLLDEPFADLDEATCEDMVVDLAQLTENSGATVVMVTHSLTQAAFLADRVIVLTTRPGGLGRDLRIAGPRPRARAFLSDPALHASVEQLRSSLREAVHGGSR